jgi:hypothetical protein
MGAATYGMTADGYGRATAQIGPENSAGCGSGSMFESECHALLHSPFFGIEAFVQPTVPGTILVLRKGRGRRLHG